MPLLRIALVTDGSYVMSDFMQPEPASAGPQSHCTMDSKELGASRRPGFLLRAPFMSVCSARTTTHTSFFAQIVNILCMLCGKLVLTGGSETATLNLVLSGTVP